MMLRVESQRYHVMSRCSGVCMSITTQIFISCDLPVSPRSLQFELRSNCGLGCLVRPPGKALEGPQAQQTLVWTPWCVPSMDMSYLLSCSSSATPRLGASSSTNCELRISRFAHLDEIGGDRRPSHESKIVELTKGYV